MWNKANRFFDQDYYVEGKEWRFSNAEVVKKSTYVAGDTETKLYYKDKLLSEEKAYELYKKYDQKWYKMNIEVRAYAFLLANESNFAIFQSAKDFLTACAMLNVKYVFWYNARFDFSIFDYYFLTNGWKDSTLVVKDMKRYGKLPDKSYQSLNGDYGQRYQMTIWKEYTNTRYQRKVHKFKMIDICNIYAGGLAKNLRDWNIKNNENQDVRKLSMDYVNANFSENDINYMRNDTQGLYLLAIAIDKTLYDITGYSLLKGDYLTAGGLAKKTLLKFMFGSKNDRANIKTFQRCFPLTAEQDLYFRNKRLYLGGKCFVNPYKKGVTQENIYKYDVNSMYPNQLRNMSYPFGIPTKYEELNERDGYCYIVSVKKLRGVIKNNMVGVWQDNLTGEYTEVINETEERLIWLEELQELENWYYLEYDIVYVLEYEERKPKGAIKFVDTFYEIKSNSKGSIKQGAKLLLNSAYGKLAQRIERDVCLYELSPETKTVHLIKKSTEIDDLSMLSVVVGSRVTALSRVDLMRFIRLICKNNPKENFIYCDTDSVHALTEYLDTDEKELGKMKNEGVYQKAIYLAPKSYLLYDGQDYEVHCKGVNINVVYNEVKGKTWDEAIKIFKPNRTFKCLSGMNVNGGKALFYVDKMIVNDKNAIKIGKKLKGLEYIDND